MQDYPRHACPGQHGLGAHVDLFSWVALLSSIISDIELYLGLPETVPKRLWLGWLDAVHWDARHQRYADRAGCSADSFSPYVGYANLYPLLLGILDNKERALKVIELAKAELMTQYGMMSVSYASVRAARHAGLRHDNRWMGHIWISTNVLMAHALRTKYIGLLGEPATELFNQLRSSMLKTSGETPWVQEAYNPVEGSAESAVSLMADRAIWLGLLESSR
ncbi:mannosyl-oligosaccharide glucosidase [Trypanosoma rangeli]|uniref:mannosyl-oligosaccharide glucosidase n=1 Tax=Trypanosoma rangeli TaxID=5698 RepID=A0A3R7K461_TRYRA|nr:mannosyl-oligosaccharide glucosidase [Trypanosoma rangeli]RNF01396.1 mannosyl-oligosaccharide glucosidase [Trypanosoma rangeli]|eukprot:RNF01396.1 mannosyl-oligosaccharide glucosidase [Trypanosoma rangeli]